MDKISINTDNLCILPIIYDNVTIEKIEYLDVYTCSDKDDNLDFIIHNTKNNKILGYHNKNSKMAIRSIVKNIEYSEDKIYLKLYKGILSRNCELVIIDTIDMIELNRYNDVEYYFELTDDLIRIGCTHTSYLHSINANKAVIKFLEMYNLDSNTVVIGCKDCIVIYSLETQSEITKYECACTKAHGNSVGNFYRFLNFGTAGLLIDKETNEVVQVITSTQKIESESLKNCYCDIILINNGDYLDKENYFICRNKIYRTEEYLKLLTIKEIIPIYKNNKNEIKHYNIETTKGLKGKMSANFRRLQINGVIDGENILDSRFDFIREKYLI